jgi:hypothetical protein
MESPSLAKRAWIALALGTILTPHALSGGATKLDENRPGLELLAEIRLPEGDSSPLQDVRWASRDSVFLLRAFEGVTEHRIAEGLPRIGQAVPGRSSHQKVRGQSFLGLDGDQAVTASSGGQLLWRPDLSAKATLDVRIFDPERNGNVSDIDFRDGVIAVLGLPSSTLAPDHVLWTARLEEPRPRFEPLIGWRDDDRGGSSSESDFRYLSVVLVFPGRGESVFLVDPSGRKKSAWNLKEQELSESSLFDDDEAGAGEPSGPRPDPRRAWFESGATTVDDVLFVGKTPAVVLRAMKNGTPEWLLLLLESDGPRVLTIPGLTPERALRVRADCRQDKDLVFAVFDRSARTSRDERVVVARIPQ